MRKWLWLLVLLTATGDVVTTAHGLNQQGIEEQNPSVERLTADIPVIPVIVGFKLAAICTALIAQHLLEKARWVPAAALLVVWGPVTLWNLAVIGIA